MADRQIRLIGITGAGGYGKSTLAAKICIKIQSFEQVFWVRFSQAYPFGQWGRWLLEQLGQAIDEKVSDDELMSLILARLRDGRHLIVWDNLETLLEPEPLSSQWKYSTYQTFLQRWLQGDGSSVILLTSREQPEIPQNLLLKCKWRRLDGLRAEDGAKLLSEHYHIQGELAELEAFSEQVDGHPLLLNLAAGLLWAEAGEDASISQLKQDNLNLFEIVGAHKDNPETNVAELLAWSIERLEPGIQNLLLNLSVYRLPFNWRAAEAIVPHQKIKKSDLRQLAKRSLLIESKKSGETWKYQFQPLIRQYLQKSAGEKLKESHSFAAEYYRRTRKKRLLPTDEIDALTEDLEIFYHLCELEQYPQAFDELGSTGRDYFLARRGYHLERINLYEPLVSQWMPEDSELESYWQMLARLGDAYAVAKQYLQATRLYEMLLDLALKNSDSSLRNISKQYEALALLNLGSIYNRKQDSQLSISFSQDALSCARLIGERGIEINALNNLGDAYNQQKRYEEAIETLELAWEKFQQLDTHYAKDFSLENSVQLYRILGGLGNAYRDIGEYKKAFRYYRRWYGFMKREGDRLGEISALHSLRRICLDIGSFSKAKKYRLQVFKVLQSSPELSGTNRLAPNSLKFILKFFESNGATDVFIKKILSFSSHKVSEQEIIKVLIASIILGDWYYFIILRHLKYCTNILNKLRITSY